MNTRIKWLMGLLVLSLFLGSTSVAWAEEPDPATQDARRRPVLLGKVTAIDGTALRLQTRRGEVTVLSDERTRFFVPGVEEPGLDDIEVESRVAVLVLFDSEGNLLARVVRARPQRPRRGWLRGQVGAIEGASLTLTLRSGAEVTLLSDESTRFLVPGVPEATIADLNVGDTVGVEATRPENEDERPYVTVVAVLRDADGKRSGLRGELTAISGTTLTIKLRSGQEIQLLTDENTYFYLPAVEEATIADLTVGAVTGAQVIEQEDGTLYAPAVGQARARPRGRWGAVRGRISAIEGNAITLIRSNPATGLGTGGEVTVLTDERTRFYVPGIPEAGIDDLAVGQIVGAAGRWNEDGELLARIVGTRQRQPAAGPDAAPPDGPNLP